jgi:hypothetical protein
VRRRGPHANLVAQANKPGRVCILPALSVRLATLLI